MSDRSTRKKATRRTVFIAAQCLPETLAALAFRPFARRASMFSPSTSAENAIAA